MDQTKTMKPALLTIALLMAAVPGFAAKNETTHKYESTYPATAVRKVIFEVPIAQLDVIATKSSELRIEGTARREYGGADEQAASQRIVDAASIVFDPKGRNIHVVRDFSGSPSWRERNSIKFKLTLYVPEGTALSIDQRVGDVTLAGRLGDVDLDVNVGKVTIDVPKLHVAELIARSRIGEVTTNLPDRTIMKQGMFAGATHFLNDSGKSTIRLKVNVGEINVTLQ